MFVALSGPNFDGHDYLAEVAAKGAVAALVERPVADAGLPQLLVREFARRVAVALVHSVVQQRERW